MGGTGGGGTVVIAYKIGETGTEKATGGAISYYNNKTIHTFTSSGTFATKANWSATNVEYVCVAGGGGSNGSSGGPGVGGPGVQLPSAWDASAIGYAHGQGRYYGGGGSGGTQTTITTSPAPGGTGGGGRGHSQNSGPNSGAANGSGGGGGSGVPAPNARAAGAPGGKGLVVIRYPT